MPLAIACVRDAAGYSFPEAAELLLDVLEHGDNAGGAFDDDGQLAALLTAVGCLRLQSPQVRIRLHTPSSCVPCFGHRRTPRP